MTPIFDIISKFIMVRIRLSTLFLSDIAFWLFNIIFGSLPLEGPRFYMTLIFNILSKFISAHVCIAFSLTTSRQQVSFATTTRQQSSFAIFATTASDTKHKVVLPISLLMQIPLFILWLFPNKYTTLCPCPSFFALSPSNGLFLLDMLDLHNLFIHFGGVDQDYDFGVILPKTPLSFLLWKLMPKMCNLLSMAAPH